jgi:hypothetical protein
MTKACKILVRTKIRYHFVKRDLDGKETFKDTLDK